MPAPVRTVIACQSLANLWADAVASQPEMRTAPPAHLQMLQHFWMSGASSMFDALTLGISALPDDAALKRLNDYKAEFQRYITEHGSQLFTRSVQ